MTTFSKSDTSTSMRTCHCPATGTRNSRTPRAVAGPIGLAFDRLDAGGRMAHAEDHFLRSHGRAIGAEQRDADAHAGPARPGSSRSSAVPLELWRCAVATAATITRGASVKRQSPTRLNTTKASAIYAAIDRRRRSAAPPIEPSPGVSQARLRLQAQGQRRGESDPTCFIVPRSTDAMMPGCAEAAARSSCCRSSARQGMAATRKPGRKRRRRARGTRTFGVARTCPSDNPDS
jgi:hypothetical protein